MALEKYMVPFLVLLCSLRLISLKQSKTSKKKSVFVVQNICIISLAKRSIVSTIYFSLAKVNGEQKKTHSTNSL